MIDIVNMKRIIKEKLLIIGDTFNVPHIIDLCKEKSIYTIVTDNRDPNISTSKYLADEYWMIDVKDIDALENKCREEKVTGIFSIPSDLCGDIALELSNRLGFHYYANPNARMYERSKDKFKKLCQRNGLLVAEDYDTRLDTLKDSDFPIIVKPVDGQANKGQSICYGKKDLEKAKEYAFANSKSKKIVVEKYIEGDELFAVYTMNNGRVALSILCGVYVNDGEPSRCYSITCNRTKHLDKYLEKVNDKVINMLREIGCNNGTAFVSSIVNSTGFYFIEMGYRLPGGMIQEGYYHISNIDYSQIYLDYNLHGNSDFPIIAYEKEMEKIACSYIIWGKKGIIKEIRGISKVNEVVGKVYSYKKEGDSVDTTELGNGAIFLVCLSADNNKDLERKINYINSSLYCFDDKGEDLLIKYNDLDKIFNGGCY